MKPFHSILAVVAIGFLLWLAGISRAKDAVPVRVLLQKANGVVLVHPLDRALFAEKGEDGARARFEEQARAIINEISLHCGISSAQAERLQLAAARDIRSFFERVATARSATEQPRWVPIAQPLQQEMNEGLFNTGSYFRKVLPKTLTGEQYAIYEVVDSRRHAYRYRAVVESVVTMWDGVVPLRAKQRRNLVRLLLDNTSPPLRFGRYDYCVVLIQAARIPDERFTALLDEAQWRVLRNSLREQHPVYAEMADAGVLPEFHIKGAEAAPEDPAPETDAPGF